MCHSADVSTSLPNDSDCSELHLAYVQASFQDWGLRSKEIQRNVKLLRRQEHQLGMTFPSFTAFNMKRQWNLLPNRWNNSAVRLGFSKGLSCLNLIMTSHLLLVMMNLWLWYILETNKKNFKGNATTILWNWGTRLHQSRWLLYRRIRKRHLIFLPKHIFSIGRQQSWLAFRCNLIWHTCHTQTEVMMTLRGLVNPIYLPVLWDQALLMANRSLLCEITGAIGAGVGFLSKYIKE